MKRALVTGASSGIGRDVIRALLADGWEVVGISRSEPGMAAEWPRFRWHCMDLSDSRYTYGLVNAIESRPIDLLVHCSLPCLLAPVLEHVAPYVPASAVFTNGSAYLATRGQEASCQA